MQEDNFINYQNTRFGDSMKRVTTMFLNKTALCIASLLVALLHGQEAGAPATVSSTPTLTTHNAPVTTTAAILHVHDSLHTPNANANTSNLPSVSGSPPNATLTQDTAENIVLNETTDTQTTSSSEQTSTLTELFPTSTSLQSTALTYSRPTSSYTPQTTPSANNETPTAASNNFAGALTQDKTTQSIQTNPDVPDNITTVQITYLQTSTLKTFVPTDLVTLPTTTESNTTKSTFTSTSEPNTTTLPSTASFTNTTNQDAATTDLQPTNSTALASTNPLVSIEPSKLSNSTIAPTYEFSTNEQTPSKTSLLNSNTTSQAPDVQTSTLIPPTPSNTPISAQQTPSANTNSSNGNVTSQAPDTDIQDPIITQPTSSDRPFSAEPPKQSESTMPTSSTSNGTVLNNTSAIPIDTLDQTTTGVPPESVLDPQAENDVVPGSLLESVSKVEKDLLNSKIAGLEDEIDSLTAGIIAVAVLFGIGLLVLAVYVLTRYTKKTSHRHNDIDFDLRRMDQDKRKTYRPYWMVEPTDAEKKPGSNHYSHLQMSSFGNTNFAYDTITEDGGRETSQVSNGNGAVASVDPNVDVSLTYKNPTEMGEEPQTNGAPSAETTTPDNIENAASHDGSKESLNSTVESTENPRSSEIVNDETARVDKYIDDLVDVDIESGQ